eukprot:3797120-Pleurochrysis_carterae.AAC.1
MPEKDKHRARFLAAAPAPANLARDGLEVVALVHARAMLLVKRQLDVVARRGIPVEPARVVHAVAVGKARDANVQLEHLVRARRQLRLVECSRDAED